MSARFDLGKKPHLGYTDSALDRAAHVRHDEAVLAGLEADPRARALIVGGEWVVARNGVPFNDPAFPLKLAGSLAQSRERVFLGLHDGAPLFGIAIDPDAIDALKSRDDLLVTDLRRIATGALVASAYLPPLAEAKAILAWHARHRFCSKCGSPSNPVHAGWRRDCPVCGTQHFPRTDPVVIMLAIDGERCLLGRQARFAKDMWSCLAGFVEPGETIEE